MKALNKEAFERKFDERYNDHPLGWKCFYTLDKGGRLSLGLVNRKIGEQYWIKFTSPYESRCLGFIGTLEEDFPFLRDPFYNINFGVRVFDLNSEERENLFKNGRIISSLAKKIKKAKKSQPQSNDGDIKAKIIYQIPRKEEISLADLSPAQKELETEMLEAVAKFNRSNSTAYVS